MREKPNKRSVAFSKTQRSEKRPREAESVPHFRVCVLISTQIKVVDVTLLHKVCPNSLNIDAYSKCDL